MNKFLIEIQEQPKSLKDTIQYFQIGEGKEILLQVSNLWNSGKFDRIIFTGMGSSYFISQAVASILLAKSLPTLAINTGELLHFQHPFITQRALLVCISQSGESYEMVKLFNILPTGLTVVAISNAANSTLVKQAECTLLCKAGKEEMTSTKTFISTYLVTSLLVKSLLRDDFEDSLLDNLVREVERLLEVRETYLEKALQLLQDSEFVQVIARGTDYATAAQSALMLMEAVKVPAAAILGGEFRHGPLEMVKEGFICLIFGNFQSGTYTQMMQLALDVLKFEGKVIFISDRNSGIIHPNLLEININSCSSELYAIPAIIPVQLMVNAWAERKGLVPGNFTHGAKVTSIE